MTYKKHLEKWNRTRNLVVKRNEELIEEWRSIPWWKFWKRLSFDEQRQIILDNWAEFEKLPKPRLMAYFPYVLRPFTKYRVGGYMMVRRNGTNEIIQGKIKKVYRDLFWGYDLALLETDKGERLITSETDDFITGEKR